MQNWIVVAFLAYFTLVWLGVCWLIARFGGWSALAERYRVEKMPAGKRYYLQSASFSAAGLPCNYGSCLTMIVGERGLGLAVLPIFRFGHPPLFIPWSEFYQPRQRTVLGFWKLFEAEIGEPAMIRVCLPGWLFAQANKAMAAAGEGSKEN